MDKLLTADEPPLAGQLDQHLDDVSLQTEYRRLVAEQAAVRRVGTLVARGADPSEVAGAVAEEIRRCVGAITAAIWRFDTSDEIALLAGVDPAALAKWPVGTRTPIEGNTLARMVYRTGLPARIDSYDNIAGAISARVRAIGVRAAVGVPIIVDGQRPGIDGRR
jgi:GAF domain-containing protein